MQKNLQEISDYWREVYSKSIDEYRPFELSAEFKRFASIFSPGRSYLYIVNLHNFKLEFISDSVAQFVNKKVSEIRLEDLLKTVLPEELVHIQLKGKVVSDFYTRYLSKAEVLQYKNMFTYRMTDKDGQVISMLYQAIPLSVHESGTPEHVLCIQTDVSHLKVMSITDVSFLHLEGGRNYLNVDVQCGYFDAHLHESKSKNLTELFTNREKEIVGYFAKGLNADQIANRLCVSPHTVKTHRRNLLKKGDCTNTTELVAKCLSNGIISPV